MKSNFRGTYLEVHPLGVAHLRFKKDGTVKLLLLVIITHYHNATFFADNHYVWRKVSTIIRNLYIGKLYIEQEGELDILNQTTGEKCHLKYMCGGMFSRDTTVIWNTYFVIIFMFLIWAMISYLIMKEWQR